MMMMMFGGCSGCCGGQCGLGYADAPVDDAAVAAGNSAVVDYDVGGGVSGVDVVAAVVRVWSCGVNTSGNRIGFARVAAVAAAVFVVFKPNRCGVGLVSVIRRCTR